MRFIRSKQPRKKELAKMSNLIVREWNGKAIRQRADGFISATDICQASGKNFGHWHELKSTKEYLEAVRSRHYRDHDNDPVESNVGGSPSETGTWVDRRVALRLAQWISPEFALQVDEWVEELMTKGAVSLAPRQPVAPPIEPKPLVLRPAIERVESLKESMAFFGIEPDNPRFKQALQDLVGDTLGLTHSLASTDKWVGVAERAEQLGISVGLVTRHRSQLGKAVKAQVSENDRKTEQRLCNGTQRTVNLYRVSQTLDAAIESFFAIKAVA